MNEHDYSELVEKWFNIATVITAIIWVAWFFGRMAIGLIQVKK